MHADDLAGAVRRFMYRARELTKDISRAVEDGKSYNNPEGEIKAIDVEEQEWKVLTPEQTEILEDVRERCAAAGMVGVPYFLNGTLNICVHRLWLNHIGFPEEKDNV